MTKRITVAIVDDEHLGRERLRRLIAPANDMEVVAICENGDVAVTTVVNDPPDLLFLDVQMPGRDGFAVVRELLSRLRAEEMPLVVFVTAYEQFALQAFEAQALDYLVKPFDDDRFGAVLDRARRLVRQSRVDAMTGKLRDLLLTMSGDARSALPREIAETAAPEQSSGKLEHLVLRTGNKSTIVRADSVDWISADGVYARVHVAPRSYLIRTPMHELEARLDARQFVRIHRSTIVNIDRVTEVHEIDRGEYAVVLGDGTRLKLSRSRRADLAARLGQAL